MKLGFYYHITLKSGYNELKVPAYLGVFLDALAQEVDHLVLFMHEANEQEARYCDYTLKSSNRTYHTLGLKTPAWDRFLRPWRTLRKIRNKIDECDVLLVRAPSPLAPAFIKHFTKTTKVCYLIVGDYIDGAMHLNQPWWRKLPIIILSYFNDRQLTRAVKQAKTLVNSQKLYDKYKKVARDIYVVQTTTLSSSDFYYREDTCDKQEINILYTGSFSFAKGLRELLEAFALLVQEKANLTLHFVGWEYEPSKPVEKYLKTRATELGIVEKIIFHGFKTLGPELNAMYRMADIYVIPSFHEGFPRTIWEAMANGLPVIATTVGSIPYNLTNYEHAILIKPGDDHAIVFAVKELLNNPALRKKIIANGYNIANAQTLELQVKKLVSILQNNSSIT